MGCQKFLDSNFPPKKEKIVNVELPNLLKKTENLSFAVIIITYYQVKKPTHYYYKLVDESLNNR